MPSKQFDTVWEGRATYHREDKQFSSPKGSPVAALEAAKTTLTMSGPQWGRKPGEDEA